MAVVRPSVRRSVGPCVRPCVRLCVRASVQAQISETVITRILKLGTMIRCFPGMMPVISEFLKNPKWPPGGHFSYFTKSDITP